MNKDHFKIMLIKKESNMKKYKGFSLIEILLALGIISFLTVASFLIYNKVDTNSYARKIND
ncbi:prepilin-type N-terminal cleavage/methylation domain-containing protein, partial [Providencia sp. wls1948]|uniref:type II secretion system protein n=1 Tax=Providencia sp. wls1948 TaxID=2675149 RepID=UPI0012B6337F